jgi:hypothetical protein
MTEDKEDDYLELKEIDGNEFRIYENEKLKLDFFKCGTRHCITAISIIIKVMIII